MQRFFFYVVDKSAQPDIPCASRILIFVPVIPYSLTNSDIQRETRWRCIQQYFHLQYFFLILHCIQHFIDSA